MSMMSKMDKAKTFEYRGKTYRIYSESEDGHWEIDVRESDGTWRRMSTGERIAEPDFSHDLHVTALNLVGRA